jgi:hypothetical protein
MRAPCPAHFILIDLIILIRFGENLNIYLSFIIYASGMTGGWRKLHNEELHNLYSSPSIIKMIKSRRVRWAGHLARMR